jgi:hypothetical protein
LLFLAAAAVHRLGTLLELQVVEALPGILVINVEMQATMR